MSAVGQVFMVLIIFTLWGRKDVPASLHRVMTGGEKGASRFVRSNHFELSPQFFLHEHGKTAELE
jgi:hypothetical protein